NQAIDTVMAWILLHVFDYADHGHPRKGLSGTNAPDSFADGVFSRPRLPREFLTDHNHGQTFSAIVLVDQPSIEQCNTKRFKIVRANNAMRSNRNFIWVRWRPPLNIEDCVERNFSLKRNVCCDSGCDHSRQITDALEHSIAQRDSCAILRVF